MHIGDAWSCSHYLSEFAGDGHVCNNDCTTRVRVKSYSDVVALCSVLIFLFNCAQLSIEGIADDWERTRQKKDDYHFACDVFAGNATNRSNWPYFHCSLSCTSTRCSHWYKHCFEDVHFRHHSFTQLLRPWFTLCNREIIAVWLHAKPDLWGEYASKPPFKVVSRMRIGMHMDVNTHQSVNVWIQI